MKKWENCIFSIIFLCALFAFSVLSGKNTLPVLQKTAENYSELYTENGIFEAAKLTFTQMDTDISENVFKRWDFIETYGKINRFLGKKEINGFSYALDKNGAYNFINFWNEVDDINLRKITQQMVNLKDATEKNNGHFMFLAFPNKFDEAWNEGYDGIPYNDHNKKVDEVLLWCRRYNLDYLDFRETLKKSGLSFEEMFYKTDHHWTGYAAFLAYQDLIAHLNDTYDAGLDPTYYYRDINNYNVEWIDNVFLGASGRNVGMSFGNNEPENFQIVYPKFKGNLQWNNYNEYGTVAEGDYHDTIIKDEYIEYTNNIYNSDCYQYYVGGVFKFDSIVNKDNPNGPRVLLIRDSVASPMMIDMAPLFSTIDCIWGKYAKEGTIEELVENGNYDYVIVAYYPEDIREDFFNFYKDVDRTDKGGDK